MKFDVLNVSDNLAISRDKSAAIKGLLIILVVFAHNRFFEEVFSVGCWEWFYCFHVAGFFILPWFYGFNDFSWLRVRKYAKRLLWPYTYMFVTLYVLNYALTKKAIVDIGLFNTYITGNFYKFRYYIGLQYLWFLPAMFSMIVLKDIYYSVVKKWKLIVIIIGAVSFVMFWIFLYRMPYPTVVNHTIAQFSLFSFVLGFAMMFLGIITRKIIEKISLPKLLLVVLMLLSLSVMIIAANTQAFNLVWWVCRIMCPLIVFMLIFHGGGVQPFYN